MNRLVRLLIGIVVALIAMNQLHAQGDSRITPNTGPRMLSDGQPVSVLLFLVPLDDFSHPVAAKLADMLSIELDLDIRVTTSMSAADMEPLAGTSQYSAERIVERVRRFGLNLPGTQLQSVLIALTQRDINTESRTLNFIFSQHNNAGRTSVVSTARMRERDSSDNTSELTDLEMLRLYKMVKRAIGELHLRLERSANPKDLLYGSINSVKSIDDMATEYRGVLQHKGQIPTDAANCQSVAPPPESGENWNEGMFFKIFPRASTLPPNYTGCQNVWVFAAGRWYASSKMYFREGVPSVWWRVAENRHLSGVYCYFQNNELVAGPPKLCDKPIEPVQGSMPPMCVADAIRQLRLSEECLRKQDSPLLLKMQQDAGKLNNKI